MVNVSCRMSGINQLKNFRKSRPKTAVDTTNFGGVAFCFLLCGIVKIRMTAGGMSKCGVWLGILAVGILLPAVLVNSSAGW